MIANADLIAGMAKGMAVLEAFDTERQRLNATLAAQRAGITRAAARRHLLTLEHLGYLESEGGWFWLSAKVLRFSGSYIASARLPRIVQPTLNRLALQTGESLSAVVLDGDEVVIVARSVNPRSSPTQRPILLAYGLHLGARLPAHATSTGRVLLAAQSKASFNAWMRGRVIPRITPQTLTETKAFRAEIAAVREQDFCIAHQQHELGVHALAVPVRDMQGHTLAAINVVTPPERLRGVALTGELLPLMQEAMGELRALL